MAKNYLTTTFFGVKSIHDFIAGLQQAVYQVPPGIFSGDNLFTFGRHLGFLDDAEFMSAFETNAISETERAIIWRTHVVTWAAKQALRREGDFVECGSYEGTTAKIICDYLGFENINKNFLLYDVFEHDNSMEHNALPAHGPDLYEKVVARFSSYPNVIINKGFIPDIFKEKLPDKIAFMHIDLNGPTAELASLEYLFERMVPGAILILDDYGWYLSFAAQKYAEDPFFAARGYQVLELPTGQGMVLK
ncbi:MAG: class I SAM-dependent methyltransferase [Methylococcaceae bacterium]|nr:MAG: class I SAM-dependent methyltransferase [Methylococcaceae bacterium]